MLSAGVAEAESVAAAALAESLPPGAKPLVPDACKGLMDSKTILSFIC